MYDTIGPIARTLRLTVIDLSSRSPSSDSTSERTTLLQPQKDLPAPSCYTTSVLSRVALPRATTWPTVSPLLKPVEAYPITVRPSSSSRCGRSISGHVLHTAYSSNSKPATNITIPWWRSSKCRPPGRFEFRTRITIPPPRLRQWVSCFLFLLSHCKPDEWSLQEVSAIPPPEILNKILEHIPGRNVDGLSSHAL